jgi:hypothetical protein
MKRAYTSSYTKEKEPTTTQWNINYLNSYFLFNTIGSRLYIMSKKTICNREPKVYKKYIFIYCLLFIFL